jgi:hypothetical protein
MSLTLLDLLKRSDKTQNKRCGGKTGKVGPFCCGEDKPLSAFGLNSHKPDRKDTYCLVCLRLRDRHRDRGRGREWNKAHNVKKRFRVTIDQYHAMLDEQGHSCRRCKIPNGDAERSAPQASDPLQAIQTALINARASQPPSVQPAGLGPQEQRTEYEQQNDQVQKNESLGSNTIKMSPNTSAEREIPP